MDDYVPFSEVQALTKLSRRQVNRLIAAHRFPAPIYVPSPRKHLWNKGEIIDWLRHEVAK